MASESLEDLFHHVKCQSDSEALKKRLLRDFNIESAILHGPNYKQPNGFWTFVLWKNDDSSKALRLHYWPDSENKEASVRGVHNHIFDMTSLVLAAQASFINRCYDIEESDRGRHFLYSVENPIAAQESEIKFLGKADSSLVGEQRKSTGEYYVLPRGAFHSANVEGQKEAVTLVAAEYDWQMPAYFLTAEKRNFDTGYVRELVSQEEREFVVRRLERFLMS